MRRRTAAYLVNNIAPVLDLPKLRIKWFGMSFLNQGR